MCWQPASSRSSRRSASPCQASKSGGESHGAYTPKIDNGSQKPADSCSSSDLRRRGGAYCRGTRFVDGRFLRCAGLASSGRLRRSGHRGMTPIRRPLSSGPTCNPWMRLPGEQAAETICGHSRRAAPVAPIPIAIATIGRTRRIPSLRDTIPPAVDKGDLAPVMSSDGSGLPLELWGGLDINSLEKLISTIEIPPRSPVLHDLWKKLITSPSGDASNADFAALRLEALYRSGLGEGSCCRD